MKQFIYVVIILLFNACVDQASHDIVYTIFNQTDKSVKVLGFDTKNESTEEIYTQPIKADKINISPNSSFKITRVTGIDADITKVYYSIRGIDSVRVVFNNEKVLVITRTPPNPCNICDADENNQHYITEQDYENAEDCNGDCE